MGAPLTRIMSAGCAAPRCHTRFCKSAPLTAPIQCNQRHRCKSGVCKRDLARIAPNAAAGQQATTIKDKGTTEVVDEIGMPLTTWLLQEERDERLPNRQLAITISSIALACKKIAHLVGRAPLINLTGLAGSGNISGEDQKKLDVIANDEFADSLRRCGRTAILASEEEDVPVAVEEAYDGQYAVVFDPLDGSSNIDAGIATGSIFGIYQTADQCIVEGMDNDEMLETCVTNVCQPGSNLLCSGYCMYSSSTVLVLTIGHGVYGFTLDKYRRVGHDQCFNAHPRSRTYLRFQ